MTYKKERLEKIIEKEIANIIFSESKDERLKFVTITKVDLTNDLSLATVYYTVMGDVAQQEATSNNLQEAKGFIKSMLGKRLEVRKIPDLRFKYDASFEEGNKIDNILKSLKNN